MRSHAASICAGVRLSSARQAVDVVLGQAVEMVGDDRARDLALVGVVDRRQLQQQALGDVARADAGRIERLHALERDLHLDRPRPRGDMPLVSASSSSSTRR